MAPSAKAKAIAEEATPLAKAGRLDEAMRKLDEALALAPDLDFAWLDKGVIFFQQNRHDDALACFDRCAAIGADYAPAARQHKGNVLLSLRRLNEARDVFVELTQRYPGFPTGWFHLARGLEMMGKQTEAMRAYMEFLNAARADRRFLAEIDYATKRLGEMTQALARKAG